MRYKKSKSLSRSRRDSQTSQWAEAIQELRRYHRLDILLKLSGMARSTLLLQSKKVLTRKDQYLAIKRRIVEIYD